MKKILYIFLVGILAIILVNAGFFYAQIRFLIKKPAAQNISEVANPKKSQPNFLSIPSLGIKAPIQYPEKQDEKVFQEFLAKGVVHYPGTALVGQLGNCYIFGHSSDFPWAKGDFKHIFALLPKIEIGAQIEISDMDGNMYIYKVTEKFVASPKDVSLLAYKKEGKKILTLQTSYPIGSAAKRYIVRAEME